VFEDQLISIEREEIPFQYQFRASFFDFSSLPALTPFYQKGEGYSEGYKKRKGLGFCPKPLILLVAGTGFEPVTFGL
jgi:hypothetical protein